MVYLINIIDSFLVILQCEDIAFPVAFTLYAPHGKFSLCAIDGDIDHIVCSCLFLFLAAGIYFAFPAY